MPTKPNGPENKGKTKVVQDAYAKFLGDMDKETNIKDRARLQYYNQRLDSALYGPDLDKMNKLKDSIYGINKRIEFADSTIKAGGFDKELNPDQMKMILGDEQYADYVTTKGRMTNLINPEKVAGTKTTDPLIYGMRNSFANPSPGYERTVVINNKPVADFRMDMGYHPVEGYRKNPSITKEYAKGGFLPLSGTSDERGSLGFVPDYEYGGYMMLPEYGFGSWLKKNAGGLLKGAGSLVGLIPGIGTIAGPVLNLAGAAVEKGQANKQAARDAAAQQKILDAQAAEEKKTQHLANLDIREQNLFGGQENINYGGTFELGGELLMQNGSNVPNITEYSKKADLHSEGIGGIPVDARGNPTSVTKTSAVGLTEGGEVTWNGYVFSNKLKSKT